MLLNLADRDCDFSNDFWPLRGFDEVGGGTPIAAANLLVR